MKFLYASLSSCEAPWMDDALKEHFEIRLEDLQTVRCQNFWNWLSTETMEFQLKYRHELAVIGVRSLRPMMTNSAITFYPQFESKND